MRYSACKKCQGGAPAIFCVTFYCLKPKDPVSGTLPAKTIPKKLEIQGGTPAIFLLTCYHSDSAKILTCVVFYIFSQNMSQIRPKIKENWSWESPGSSPGSPWGPKGAPVRKVPPKRSSPPPRGPILTPVRHFFFVRASWILKKRGPGAPSKSDIVFCRFRVCPEGGNGALAYTRAPFSLLQADPKRPPKCCLLYTSDAADE